MRESRADRRRAQVRRRRAVQHADILGKVQWIGRPGHRRPYRLVLNPEGEVVALGGQWYGDDPMNPESYGKGGLPFNPGDGPVVAAPLSVALTWGPDQLWTWGDEPPALEEERDR